MAKKSPGLSMESPNKPDTCFILGLSQRCGTNFVYRLLNQHRRCIAPGPIWEDFLISRVQRLAEYVDGVYEDWDEKEWGFESTLGGKYRLDHLLGEAIGEFLRLQLDPENGESPFLRNNKRPEDIRYLLTKTPSPEGIVHFHRFFPNAKLILLVRDGRSVVESMVSSFGASYKEMMKVWRDNAIMIDQFRSHAPRDTNQYLIVKYEDLVLRKHESVKSILSFLNLDPREYDFAAAESIGITGSSSLMRDHETLHWRPQVQTAEFDPVFRYRDWSPSMHARFNLIAGEQMKIFGYELEPKRTWHLLHAIRHRIV